MLILCTLSHYQTVEDNAIVVYLDTVYIEYLQSS